MIFFKLNHFFINFFRSRSQNVSGKWVQVLNDSGIRDLDDAAVEAFKEAAPFPNPPEGIVESDGTIKIRWDFILEA